VTAVVVTPDAMTLNPGLMGTFSAAAQDQFGNTMTGVLFTWSIDDDTVASISGGNVEALESGTAVVTATAQGTSVFGSATLTVTNEPSVVASIDTTPSVVTLHVGETQQFTAVARDQFGSVMNTAFTWASTDADIATVSTTGLATALAAGAVEISASSGLKSGASDLVVAAGYVLSGTVRDSLGNAVPDATVTVVSANLHGTTGIDGRYSIADVPAGTREVTAAKLSYVTSSQTVAISDDTTLDFTLSFGAAPMPTDDNSSDGDGCGCQSSGGSSSWALSLLGLMFWRRRHAR